MLKGNFQEEKLQKDSKLQAVFSKLSGILPKAEELGNSNHKTMSSDIIESVLVDSAIPITPSWQDNIYIYEEAESISAVVKRLEMELRRAKRSQLSCGEVLLPCGLLARIARDIVTMAESEPCGLRGCTLYIDFEKEEQQQQLSSSLRRLGTVRCDPGTACTFELYLILKENDPGWNFLPQFLRNLARGNTIIISRAYTLNKKKLYRTAIE